VEKILTLAAKGVGTTVMLVVLGTLGALHNDVSHAVPALGYWATVIAMWGLGVLVAALRPAPRI